jgi:phage protein D
VGLKTPAARIQLNGNDRGPDFMARLLSITITDEAGTKADTCEIELDAGPDKSAPNGFTAPPKGAALKVWIGYAPEPTYMGSFKVDSWTKRGPGRTLTISGKAADMTSAIKMPRTRSHHEMTVKQIVEKIAGEEGLAAVVDARIGARLVPHIDQHTESNLGFLSRLAKRQGATFKLADGKVIFAAKGSRKLPSGADKQSITLIPSQVSEWECEAGERGDFGSVSCSYIDHATGRRHAAHSGSGKLIHRDKRLYGSQAEAEAAADATYGDLTRGKKKVDIQMPGDPTIFAEALVTLKGFDVDVDGDYLAKTVTHTYARGYRTSLALETAGDVEPAADTQSDPDDQTG